MINLVLSLAGLLIWVVWAYRNRQMLGYAIPPVSWLLHSVIFYVARFALSDGSPSEFFTLWSSILRLHALILAVGIGAINLAYRGRNLP